jgi:hypothetical protein
MFKVYLENWEEQNWLLLQRLGFQFRQNLRRFVKFKSQAIGLVLFLVYLVLRRSYELLNALIYFGGLQEHRLHISPEVPSLGATEHTWQLKEKVGPSGFIR